MLDLTPWLAPIGRIQGSEEAKVEARQSVLPTLAVTESSVSRQVDEDNAVGLSVSMNFLPRQMGWMVLLAVALVGCSGRKDAAVKPDYATGAENLKQAIIAAAKQDPHHQPEWDKTTGDLARRYAHALRNNLLDRETGPLAREAVAQGCRAPFVRYLVFRHRVSLQDRVDEAFAREGQAISDELENGPYPAVVRAYASWRAYLTWYKVFAREREPEVRLRLRDRFWTATMESVADPQVPEWMSRTLASELDYQWSTSKQDRGYVDEQIDAAFLARFGDCASIHYFRGERAVRLAWEARGGGYADTVTKEGWRIFGEQLKLAKTELERAWELAPDEVSVAGEMIKVCMGLGLPRAEMERWFQRGVATGEEPSFVSNNKHAYLAGRWHGSLEQQFDFARECLARPTYGWKASLLLWETHRDHRRIDGLPVSYFGQPEVWAGIKQSLSAYLAYNPESSFYRMYYAYHAWLAQDWPVLNEQLALLDPAKADLDEIGGESVYAKMSAEAKAHGAF